VSASPTGGAPSRRLLRRRSNPNAIYNYSLPREAYSSSTRIVTFFYTSGSMNCNLLFVYAVAILSVAKLAIVLNKLRLDVSLKADNYYYQNAT
jgi:hypothetical protein